MVLNALVSSFERERKFSVGVRSMQTVAPYYVLYRIRKAVRSFKLQFRKLLGNI